MKITTEAYLQSLKQHPQQGQHILACQQDDLIAVYQAYNHSIADYAVKHQHFGGPNYSYNRMSWIKPNFLWMMYRCGWAAKENQERVLAIWITKENFDNVLRQAVLSSYDSRFYPSHEAWKNEMDNKEVRLQWDPDHDPYGRKMERRAVQLGLKGQMLKVFGRENIRLIEDVTHFVKEQHTFVSGSALEKLQVPVERLYVPKDAELCRKIGLSEVGDL